MTHADNGEVRVRPSANPVAGNPTATEPREISVKAAAGRLECTVQRLNQLAVLGVVVKTRHGHLDWPETERRMSAWVEEVAWSRAQLRRCEGPPEYWAAQGRNVDILGGAMASELIELAAIVGALRSAVETHDTAVGVSTCRTAAEASALRRAVGSQVERLATTLHEIRERGRQHLAYMEEHGASAADALREAITRASW